MDIRLKSEDATYISSDQVYDLIADYPDNPYIFILQTGEFKGHAFILNPDMQFITGTDETGQEIIVPIRKE
jgi:hypothetical protein